MSSEEFYSCTWYDWSLWMYKIHRDRKNRLEDQELLMEMFRSSLTLYYNWNRGENNKQLEPQDFWVLSYDKPKSTDTEPTEEEKAKLIETIRRLEKLNKKKRG
jgi:hypothetical protein